MNFSKEHLKAIAAYQSRTNTRLGLSNLAGVVFIKPDGSRETLTLTALMNYYHQQLREDKEAKKREQKRKGV